ncbi:hypothetical protein [Halomontanus rarus]|uniref:hypothetical protein n=1 Tax=Halomontanus rarus TaxID=3034020 RepID=UPI0023E858B5|nr:hypothetical protein [Halovivax sp. TS33]
MNKTEPKELETWDFHELPEIESDRNVDPDNDFTPTPDGQVRCYFDGELMMSLTSNLGEQFTIGFDSEPGEPHALTFTAPISMWENEEPPEPALETMMTEEEIPIGEQRDPSPNTRVFVPASEVSWDFEITVETTPYEVDDE